jgi:hypothetical protein
VFLSLIYIDLDLNTHSLVYFINAWISHTNLFFIECFYCWNLQRVLDLVSLPITLDLTLISLSCL